MTNTMETENITHLSLDELCDYIVKRHHSYVKTQIPFLNKNLEKICITHGANHPELHEIKSLFDESAGDLTMHMQKEELMLFPYIQNMARAKRNGTPAGSPVFGSVTHPVAMMVSEHETEEMRFKKIAEISRNYTIPGDADSTYQETLTGLKEFENDLHRHIFLENNILFPKSVELESGLRN